MQPALAQDQALEARVPPLELSLVPFRGRYRNLIDQPRKGLRNLLCFSALWPQGFVLCTFFLQSVSCSAGTVWLIWDWNHRCGPAMIKKNSEVWRQGARL